MEQMIKAELPIVSNAIVIGDQRIYLVCLITLKVCGGEGEGMEAGYVSLCVHIYRWRWMTKVFRPTS